MTDQSLTVDTTPPAAGAGVEMVAVPPRRVWSRRLFLLLAWIFAACVAIQVFLAGMATFAGPDWWARHRTFVHFFELLPILMLITAFVGRMPARTKWLSLGVFVLIGLQYATVEIATSSGIPELAALHPVNALAIFWLAISLATRGPTTS